MNHRTQLGWNYGAVHCAVECWRLELKRQRCEQWKTPVLDLVFVMVRVCSDRLVVGRTHAGRHKHPVRELRSEEMQ